MGILGGLVANNAILDAARFHEGHNHLQAAIAQAGVIVTIFPKHVCHHHEMGFKSKEKMALINLCDYGARANDKALKHQAIHVLQWCSAGKKTHLKLYTHKNEEHVYVMAGRLGLSKHLSDAMSIQEAKHLGHESMGLHAEAHLLSRIFKSGTLAKAIGFRCE